jgi:hypothetical protein
MLKTHKALAGIEEAAADYLYERPLHRLVLTAQRRGHSEHMARHKQTWWKDTSRGTKTGAVEEETMHCWKSRI